MAAAAPKAGGSVPEAGGSAEAPLQYSLLLQYLVGDKRQPRLLEPGSLGGIPSPAKSEEQKMIERAMESCAFKAALACVGVLGTKPSRCSTSELQPRSASSPLEESPPREPQAAGILVLLCLMKSLPPPFAVISHTSAFLKPALSQEHFPGTEPAASEHGGNSISTADVAQCGLFPQASHLQSLEFATRHRQ
ncbi:mitochondrial import inner membrane translocase subunit Tim22 isoform X2 [Marmota marmota marmota]|uniref:mitochondrial import inner membrane translocase subunit Tim22 isoform X2 n=1 Tax=Marmota marmota marmota TaxID=9994 RepID=UPI00209351D8|nr:mitochondrial import inner membrane translocase subunit Tim22 isoform X2 [Marmota marmota marmota]